MASIGVSLREHPELSAMFKVAERRHLNAEELRLYCEIAPDCTHKARAAREVEQVESEVTLRTVEAIFERYPFAVKHDMANEKCLRDVRYVSVYATQTMLMNDPEWFEDKLLLWLRTILQAFEFPPELPPEPTLLQRIGERLGRGEVTQEPKLPGHLRSIQATYTLLKENYQLSLSEEAYDLMQAPLQQAADVLAEE